MSQFKKNPLAIALLGALVFAGAALQGCSSDEQNTPVHTGGSGGASHGGSGGKASTAGTAGKSVSEGGAAGETPVGDAGMGGEMSMGGEGGAPSTPCELSFNNSTLTALTTNGGVLPDLP